MSKQTCGHGGDLSHTLSAHIYFSAVLITFTNFIVMSLLAAEFTHSLCDTEPVLSQLFVIRDSSPTPGAYLLNVTAAGYSPDHCQCPCPLRSFRAR